MQPLSKGQVLIADVRAGFVVFLVALPLCLGVALASGAPMFAGLVAGIVGGIVVGLISGSNSSVSGPAAGLTAIVLAQIALLGSFPAFLLAVFLAGLLQIGMGLGRAGVLAAFFPTSVIKGLLAAIGIIIVLKQIPHVLGHDNDPEGDFEFFQFDKQNTFTEILDITNDIQPGATVIGLLSLALLIGWDRWKLLKHSPIPSPMIVVGLGVLLSELFRTLGSPWLIEASHMVEVPIPKDFDAFLAQFQSPDFGQWANKKIWIAALTIAAVASLETLLNLEAVDKIDPKQRASPPNRELFAQGVGNCVAGLIGGIPVTSVIVRSSVNINAGGQTKVSTVVHGALLLGSVALMPALLNRIPLSCLAAILLMTGVKLASIKLIRQMWKSGASQFVPFIITVLAIVFTDLLIGVVIGLAVALANILRSNVRKPLRIFIEKHMGGDIVRIELASQVSFLNKAAIAAALDDIPERGRVVIDARQTDYIDPDIVGLLHDFRDIEAPSKEIELSLIGFRERYQLTESKQFVDFSTRDLQQAMTPAQVLELLREGHQRFLTNRRLTRDFGQQVRATAAGQHPLAVILHCIDSRTPAELLFDLGVGDAFSVRLAGNILSQKALGSIEYACAVAGAKLIMVLGHTRCGAVTAAVNLYCGAPMPDVVAKCEHIKYIVEDIGASIDPSAAPTFNELPAEQKNLMYDAVSQKNVVRVVEAILESSAILRSLVESGQLGIVGGIYDVATARIEYLADHGADAVKRTVHAINFPSI